MQWWMRKIALLVIMQMPFHKEQKTEWMSTMNKEKNKISKVTYSVPKVTFELISSIYDWLVSEK